MSNTGSNAHGVEQTQEEYNFDADHYLRKLPERIRHFLMYEAVNNISAKEIFQAYHSGFMEWDDILRQGKAHNERQHRSDYNGDYPGGRQARKYR